MAEHLALDKDFNSVGDVIHSGNTIPLRDRILNEQGEIRKHVNIFLGSEDVKRLGGLKTKLKSNTRKDAKGFFSRPFAYFAGKNLRGVYAHKRRRHRENKGR